MARVCSFSALIIAIDANQLHGEMKQSPNLKEEMERHLDYLKTNGVP